MRVLRSLASLPLAILVVVLVASCQRSESPSTSSSQTAAPAVAETQTTPPPPPEPPQTSIGKLVRVETANKTKARIQYLTIEGLKSGVDEMEAEKGNVFVVLHFEGKPPEPKKEEDGLVTLQSGSDGRLQAEDNADTGEPNLWLTDAAGTKYSEWTSLWDKENGTVSFEVPAGATGLVFHDGEANAYPIEPKPAEATPATPSK